MTIGAAVFLVLNRSTSSGGATLGSRVSDASFGVALFAFPIVGALVASRRPENRIGWLLVGTGLALAVVAFASGYAEYALFTEPGSLPAGKEVAWVQSWLFAIPLFGLVTFLLLLFPSGRLLSRRWRPAAWLACGAILLAVISEMIRPGPLQEFDTVENPFGIEDARSILEASSTVSFFLVFLTIIVAAVSLLRRFRRSRDVEREQIKWVVAACGLLAAAFLSGPILFWWIPPVGDAWEALIVIAIATIPIAVGFSILRHRLYDIDRIINRTVVYLALTALLAGLYFGIVIGLQAAFSSLTRGNDLAIAGSTLAVAALFRPARRRIQELVDRRFYRQGYDAEQTLNAFSQRLRDEVDLNQLGADLGTIIHETMQPTHISLWLRPRAQLRDDRVGSRDQIVGPARTSS